VAVAEFVAALVVQHIPLLLNVVCHIPKLGYKNYLTPDGSVNVWWVAILTAGEGWHNNHHAFPGSARSGLRPFEIDLSWLTIRLMKLLGLTSWMREETILSQCKAAVKSTASIAN
jgi:stearoyl-CoA desaturase (delta-9 desaturase)